MRTEEVHHVLYKIYTHTYTTALEFLLLLLFFGLVRVVFAPALCNSTCTLI